MWYVVIQFYSAYAVICLALSTEMNVNVKKCISYLSAAGLTQFSAYMKTCGTN
jgi:hypothetical protein